MFANRADDWFAEGWKERRKDDGRNKVAEEWVYLLPKIPIVLDNEAKFIDSSARDLKTFVARSLIPRHEGTVHEAENSGLLSVRWNGKK